MIFRRTYRTRSAAPCQTCARTRIFLIVAAVLIVAMPLLGEKLSLLTKVKPMGIALAIMGLGLLAFTIRFISWRREEAQKRMNNILSIERD